MTTLIKRFENTVRNLCQSILESKSTFAPIAYLSKELEESWSRDFVVEINDDIQQLANAADADGTFCFNRWDGVLSLSSGFFEQWTMLETRMSNTGARDAAANITIEEVFALFMLHELAHIRQNLTTERHADIRGAQNVLRSVDYYADMLAILMAVRLEDPAWSGSNADKNSRIALGKKAYAAMLAARIFNPFDPAELRMTPNRVRRMFLLYLQHFRIISEGMVPDSLQLLFEPAVDFRQMRAVTTGGIDALDRASFCELLSREVGTTYLWLSFPTGVLTPKIIRVNDAGAHGGQIAGDLADMIFDPSDLEGNYTRAKNVFRFIASSPEGRELFQSNPNDVLVNYAKPSGGAAHEE